MPIATASSRPSRAARSVTGRGQGRPGAAPAPSRRHPGTRSGRGAPRFDHRVTRRPARPSSLLGHYDRQVGRVLTGNVSMAC